MESEPRITTREGIRKPDIVAVRGDVALVIDAQVRADVPGLNRLHDEKCRYYSENGDLREEIQRQTRVTVLRFMSVTLLWRGVWSDASAISLMEVGAIRRRDLRIISSRIVIGGIVAFKMVNKKTYVTRRRSIRPV